MLRHRSLIPLSRQHQHALALCVRLERALRRGPVDSDAWQKEIGQHYVREIRLHFGTEEKVVFPAAKRAPELGSLVEELLGEHKRLRMFFDCAARREMDPAGLGEFAKLLSAHIRKEERQLFEGMQRLMRADEIARLEQELAQALSGATQVCILPEASRNFTR